MFLTCGTTLRLLIFILVTEKSNCIRRKFLLYTEQVTWNDAYETCKHDGGQLLKLYSVEEDFVLKKLLLTNQIKDDFWIGLNTDNAEAKKESDFVFADCQPLSWSNWDGGFDGSKQSQCVFAKKDSRLWIRENCDKYASFICDIPNGECTYEIAAKTCPTLEADKTVETHVLTGDNCRSLCETRIRNGKKCYAYHMSNQCVLHHSSNPYFCDAGLGIWSIMNLRRCYSYGQSSQKFDQSLKSEGPFKRTCTSYEPNNDATTTTTQITITEPTRATDQATTTKYTTTQPTTATDQATTTEYTTTQPTTATKQPSTTEYTTTQPTTATNEPTITEYTTTHSTTATDQATTTKYTTTQPTTAMNQSTTTEYTTTQLITTESTTKTNQPTTAEPKSTTTQPTITQPTTSTPSSNTTTQPTISTESTSTPSNKPTATNTTTETTTSDETSSTQSTTESQSTEIRATESNLETLSQSTSLLTTKSTTEAMESEVCFCDICGKRNMTAIEKEMEKVRRDLKVNNAELSSTRRKKESATDDRPSAQNIGYIGIILFVALFGSIILLDITKIYSDVKTLS